MALELLLFGAPTVLVVGIPAPLQHRRAVLLLALLVLRAGRPVERTVLAEAIWPEREPEEAAMNLRRALADLRTMLGPEADRVVAEGRRALRLTAPCDVLRFDDAVRRYGQGADPDAALAALEEYRGPLLQDWTDGCIEPERVHRAESLAALAEDLARRNLAKGRGLEALRLCDRAEAASPYRETTLRLRLDAHLAQGDRAAAHAAFAAFARRLDRDLGLAPSAETRRFVERLRKPKDDGRRTSGPLVGREGETARLREAIGGGGIVTVVGPGRVGKTRLALQAIADAPDAGLVDLLALPSGASVGTILDAIDVPGDPLLLDNAEHLLPAVALAVEALARRRRAVLVTSRSPLGFAGERLLGLAPLSEASAARLFALRAGTDATLAPDLVARTCRRLEGLPLAIELAAARLRTLPLPELVTRLEREDGLALLTGGPVDAPERQRTMAATVAWSLRLLSPPAHEALALLAAFRGGFTLESAEAVAGSGALEALSELVDQSLLSVDRGSDPTRYRMLETVRTVASTHPRAGEAAHPLALWAAEFSKEAYEGFWHGDPARWARRVAEEEANLRAGLESADAATAGRIVEAVETFWWHDGRFREGIAWREVAHDKALRAGDAEGAAGHRLSVEQFRRLLGEPNRARACFRERIEARIAAGDHRTASYLLHSLGFLEHDDGDLERAAATMREGLAAAERIGEPGLVAYAWRGIAAVDLARGQVAEAVDRLCRAVAAFRGESLPVQAAPTSVLLGEALLASGDLAGAAAIFELAAVEARGQGQPSVEMGAELGAAKVALAMGLPEAAEPRLDRAEALSKDRDTAEGRAEVASLRSALARAQGSPAPKLAFDALFAPHAAHLPYPTLARLVEEAARTAEAIGPSLEARRLRSEVESAREAARAGAWSSSLVVTRVLAAFSPETIRASTRNEERLRSRRSEAS